MNRRIDRLNDWLYSSDTISALRLILARGRKLNDFTFYKNQLILFEMFLETECQLDSRSAWESAETNLRGVGASARAFHLLRDHRLRAASASDNLEKPL